MAYGNRFDIINGNKQLKKMLLDGILGARISLPFRIKLDNSLLSLYLILSPSWLARILESDSHNVPFLDFISSGMRNNPDGLTLMNFSIDDNIDDLVKSFFDKQFSLLNRPINEWHSSINNWDLFVESLREKFGDSWAFNIIALISSGIKSKEGFFDDFNELSNPRMSLCKRVKCARMKSGNINYWINSIENSQDITFVILVFLVWATPRTIMALYKEIAEKIGQFSGSSIALIFKSLLNTSKQSEFTTSQAKEIIEFLKENGNETLNYLICLRLPLKHRNIFILENIENVAECLQEELAEIKLKFLIECYLSNPQDKSILEDVKKYYSHSKNYKSDFYIFYKYYIENASEIPIDIANIIMSEVKSYPRIIALIAEKSCRQYANKNIIAVGKIAITQKWFD